MPRQKNKPKLTRRQQLELIREMGADRFQQFMRHANRRLVECVRECAPDKPRSKAETTRAAVDAFCKLEALGQAYLNEELAASKVAESIAAQAQRDPHDSKPRVVIIDASEDTSDGTAKTRASDDDYDKTEPATDAGETGGSASK